MRKHWNYGLAIERPGGTPGVAAQGGGDADRAGRGFSRLQSIALDPEGSTAMVTRMVATYEDS
jgi:hypothetical protein